MSLIHRHSSPQRQCHYHNRLCSRYHWVDMGRCPLSMGLCSSSCASHHRLCINLRIRRVRGYCPRNTHNPVQGLEQQDNHWRVSSPFTVLRTYGCWATTYSYIETLIHGIVSMAIICRYSRIQSEILTQRTPSRLYTRLLPSQLRLVTSSSRCTSSSNGPHYGSILLHWWCDDQGYQEI